MIYLDRLASARRQREAENARRNRAEIVKALSHGQITKRDLFKMGIFTTTGLLVAKNGLSPFAQSAYAAVPTGTPRSPLFGADKLKFKQDLPRAIIQKPVPMLPVGDGSYSFGGLPATTELYAREYSYHEDYTNYGTYACPQGGPIEGRPPGKFFKHQRWSEIPPKVGYLLSLGQVNDDTKNTQAPKPVQFHPSMPVQNKNAVWAFGTRGPGQVYQEAGLATAPGVPPLFQMRYGEPVLCRIYNDLPNDVTQNYGFGRNEISTHYHNAHNGAESDGACNAYHFPGTFYDYHWSCTVARRDMPNIRATNVAGWEDKCSTVKDDGSFARVPGDFRELQGTMWFHDHRFFYTAENVYKGNFALVQMYSGPDRGNESINDGVNLRLPSGSQKPWGNVDFDVYLSFLNVAFDSEGQLFFDIFDTDGFLGDMMLVNGAYAPNFKVMPRRYRFRMLNASMARFIRLMFSVEKYTGTGSYKVGSPLPVWVIANDGNLLPTPVKTSDIETQGVAERFDVIVDFSAFKKGDLIHLVNRMQYSSDGRKPDKTLSLAEARRGVSVDPAVGPVMQFEVVDTLQSVDNIYKTYTLADKDYSLNLDAVYASDPKYTLTTQIPEEVPVRTRTIEFKRGADNPRDPITGQCTPECGDIESFPWGVSVEGQASHSLNANRISALIPEPGQVEHWILVNGGGGWDHPIHLHFEEGITLTRFGTPMHPTEQMARKDVWRLNPGGKIKFQVRFGEFGGAYVAHCHNTIHEDFAMLMRYQLLTPRYAIGAYEKQAQWMETDTPIPSRNGVTFKTPEILKEGDPRKTTTAALTKK